MSGLTTRGVPYAVATDALVDYPALSLALANKIDSDAAGTTAAVTPGANVTPTVGLYRRAGSGLVICSVTATTGAALGDPGLLFTVPTGYRPPAMIFGTLVNVGTAAAVRVHIDTDGTVKAQGTTASGAILRGTLVWPI